jgi:hypothetical protein
MIKDSFCVLLATYAYDLKSETVVSLVIVNMNKNLFAVFMSYLNV